MKEKYVIRQDADHETGVHGMHHPLIIAVDSPYFDNPYTTRPSEEEGVTFAQAKLQAIAKLREMRAELVQVIKGIGEMNENQVF